MGLSHKALQDKRAKKTAKRKVATKSKGGRGSGDGRIA